MIRPMYQSLMALVCILAVCCAPLSRAHGQERPAVVNPCMHWFSYLGGDATDHGRHVAVDQMGNIVVAGITASRNFPVRNAFQSQLAGNLDAWVVKMTRDGGVLWATYYGGRGVEEVSGLAVDPAGNIILSGFTSSADFPVSENARQKQLAGKNDAFIVSFNLDGERNWSTLLGGTFSDEANGLAVDRSGNIIICGGSYSTNFPITDKCLQPSNGGDYDVFVAKFSTSGELRWSTYFGGYSLDYGTAVAAEADGAITVTGYTEGRNFPVTSTADQGSYAGGAYDAFLLRLSPAGERVWSTFVGGSDTEQGTDVASDGKGGVVITGYSQSTDFHQRNGVGQTALAGRVDVFVSKYDARGTRQWSTFIGGRRLDDATGVTIMGDASVVVTGYTESTDFPLTAGAFAARERGLVDAFVARFSADGTLLWSSLLAGRDWDAAYSVASDTDGNIVVAGGTASTDLPVTGNALQAANAGFEDAMLARIVFNTPGAIAGEDRTLCAGNSTKLSAVMSGGRQPYSFRWSPAEGLDATDVQAPTATPTTTTAYIVAVQDGNGCLATDTVVVTVLPTPRIDLVPTINICAGSSARLKPEISEGREPYTFAWSPEAGISSTTTEAPDVAPKTTTAYELVVTDANGCSARDTVVVMVNERPKADAGADVAVCLGSPVRIGGEATGGQAPYTYEWTPDDGLSRDDVAMPDVQPTATTVYRVQVKDANGCVGGDSVTVTVHPMPVADAGEDRLICPGGSVVLEGRASEGRAPYTWAWTPADGLDRADAKKVNATPERTTTYTLLVTDSRGCTVRDEVVVTVPPSMMVAIEETPGMCAGGSVEIRTKILGGTPPYTQEWKPAAGLSDPASLTPAASPDKSTNYTITVTDANGCIAKTSVQVTVYPLPKVKASKSVTICPGSSTDLVAAASHGTPPFTYAWSPGTGLDDATSATPVASPGESTEYRVLVTDAHGCTVADTSTVTIAEPIEVEAGRGAIICRGTSANLDAESSGGTGRLKVAWSPANGLSSTTVANPSASPEKTTTYTFTATDANGCFRSDTVTVYVLTPPDVRMGREVTLCPGTSATIEATVAGGKEPYAVEWSPIDGLDAPSSLTPVVTPKRTTTYTMKVTDANGCEGSAQVTVNVHPSIRVSAGEDFEICEGTHAKLNGKVYGGSGKITYRWTPTTGLNSDDVPKPLAGPMTTTEYVLTVTDANGCSASDTVRVTVYKKPTGDAGPDRTICPGGQVTIGAQAEPTEPLTYSWSPEKGLSDASVRNPVAAVEKRSRYVLTVTDGHGCEGRDTVVVDVTPVPVPHISSGSGTTTICEGGSVELDAGGGYAGYAWSSGERTRTIVVRDSLSRTVTVTTAEGCTAISKPVSITINRHPIPAITVKGSTQLCEGDDAVLEAPRADSWKWSTGADTRSIRVTQAGSYSVSVIDRHGCSGTSEPVTITVVSRPVAALARSGDTLFASGGVSYTWYHEGDRIAGTGATHIASKSGDYKVKALNENGCTATSNMIRVKLPKKKK